VSSADGLRPSQANIRDSNSAPAAYLTQRPSIPSIRIRVSSGIQRQPVVARRGSTSSSLKEFRLHPEKFLSSNNRYLPLLKRNAAEIETKLKKQEQQQKIIDNHHLQIRNQQLSQLSDQASDLTFDDADVKSFLSEEIATTIIESMTSYKRPDILTTDTKMKRYVFLVAPG